MTNKFVNELINFLPLNIKEGKDFKFIAYHERNIDLCIENEMYQNAYISCHMIFMYIIYSYILRIRNKDLKKFIDLISCIGDESTKEWATSDTPFVFSNYKEKSILNFLFLLGIEKNHIKEYKDIITYRNKILHATGNIMNNTLNEFNSQIKKIIKCLEHISEKTEDETCYWIYTNFLNDYGKSNRILSENEYEDYINENLIRKNYLSLSDMKKIAKIEYSEYVGFIYKKKFKPLIKFINKKYPRIIQQRCVVLE